MKNKFKLIFFITILSLFYSCKKEVVNPITLTSEHGLGALKTPRNIYESYPIFSEEGIEKNLLTSFTQKYPPVGNQGAANTCVAWAMGYGARSVAYRASHTSTTWSNNTNVFSPQYVYNSLVNGNCNNGLYASSVFNLFKTQGVCVLNKMPYVANQCSTLPTAVMKANAVNYKIINGSWGTISIPTSSSGVTSCVNKIKTKLLAGSAVIVGFNVDSNYDNLGPNQILKIYTPSTVRGGHMNIIVGYNEPGRYFILLNSWGTSWSTGGMARVSYDYVAVGNWDELYFMNKQ